MTNSYFKVNCKDYANEYFFFDKLSFESVSNAYAKAMSRANDVFDGLIKERRIDRTPKNLISTWDSPLPTGPWNNTPVIGVYLDPRKHQFDGEVN